MGTYRQEYIVLANAIVTNAIVVPTDAEVKAGGDQESDTFLVHIGLPDGQLKRYVNAYCADLDDYDILLGMDIITETDFVITNADSKTTFQFRTPSEGGVEL